MRRAREIQFPATSAQLEAAGYEYKYTRACKRCGVAIEFWLTPAKKWAPLERQSTGGGRGPAVRISHFSTCPFANEFRRTETQLDLLFEE